MFGDGIDKKALVCMAAINTWYKVGFGKLQVCGEDGSHCNDSERLLIQQTKEMYHRLCNVEAFAATVSKNIGQNRAGSSTIV